MKRFASCLVISVSVLLASPWAVADESARTLFYRLEVLNDQLVTLHVGDPFAIYAEKQRIEERLRQLANEGDPNAAYYLGLVLLQNCVRLEKVKVPPELIRGMRLVQILCDESPLWFRQAAEKGHYTAAEYLGDAYRNGHGVEKSNLAAIEWYYKAGRLALKNGKREVALRMLENMVKLSPNHQLRRELEERLYPKDLNQPKRRPQQQKLM